MKRFYVPEFVNANVPDIAIDYANDVCEYIDEGDDLYYFTQQWVDDHLIYDDDQWELLQYYFRPGQLPEYPLSNAIDYLVNDIISIIEESEPEDEQ